LTLLLPLIWTAILTAKRRNAVRNTRKSQYIVRSVQKYNGHTISILLILFHVVWVGFWCLFALSTNYKAKKKSNCCTFKVQFELINPTCMQGVFVYCLLLVSLLFSCAEDVEFKTEDISDVNPSKGYILKIETSEDISWVSKQSCTLEYIENGNSVLYSARLKCRGGASSKYEKHSYSLEIDTSINLCGVAVDDDWILNASYIDKTFQRHKLSYDLFREMDTSNVAARSAYAQVYLNGEFQGLYVVMEEINGSMIGLAKDEDEAMLFKDPPIFYSARLEWVQDSNNYYQQKFPKPDVIDHSGYLDRLVELLHHSSDRVFAQEITSHFCIDNIIDWHLILLLTNNDDGLFKNFYLFKKGNQSTFNFAIWDYDHSFGRDGDGEFNMLDRLVNPEKICLIRRLMNVEHIRYRERLKSRWDELCELNVFTVDHINQMIAENDRLLRPNIHANFGRWPIDSKWYQDVNNYVDEIEILKKYIALRIPQLNNYFKRL